jgi:hypothetical protein
VCWRVRWCAVLLCVVVCSVTDCLFFRPVTVALGVAHSRETAPNTAAHGMASSPTSPCVVANITMLPDRHTASKCINTCTISARG